MHQEDHLGPQRLSPTNINRNVDQYFVQNSIVIVLESPCPWGFSRTNLQVLFLVLGPQVLVLGPQSLEKLSMILHSANNLLCIITWFINSVTTTIHEVTVKNVSKPFFAQCCCPWGFKLRTNLQVFSLSLSLNSKSLITLFQNSSTNFCLIADWSVCLWQLVILSPVVTVRPTFSWVKLINFLRSSVATVCEHSEAKLPKL